MTAVLLTFQFGKALGTDGVVAWIRDRSWHDFTRSHAELYCIYGLVRT